jgi:hypothetical protein
MTNAEARQILIDYNSWRQNKGACLLDLKKITPAIEAAIVALSDSENFDLTIAYECGYFKGKRSKSAIAQAIRHAAVNWPQYLGDVECGVIDLFVCKTRVAQYVGGHTVPIYINEKDWRMGCMTARTFMLLVAEALES